MPRSIKAPFAAAASSAVALGLLAYAAFSVGPIERLDLRIYLHFEFVEGPGVDPARLLVHLGDLGPLLLCTAAVVGAGLYFGRRREVVAALAVIVGANLTTQLLKVALEQPRHAVQGTPSKFLIELLPSNDAFPSGHTTAVAAVAVALLFVVPARHIVSAATVGFLLTASVAISVVVLGWHYPSDALGGILVAVTWGFAMLAVLRLRTHLSRAKTHQGRPIHAPLVASRE